MPTRPALLGGLLALVFPLASGAGAASLTFTDFSDLSGLQLNGTVPGIHGCAASGEGSTCSPVTGNALRLTNGPGQTSSAFTNAAMTLGTGGSFTTSFSFRIANPGPFPDTDGAGGDGFTFLLQADSNAELGLPGGSGLGYENITNSLAVEFDTFFLSGVAVPYADLDGNHVSVNAGGDFGNVPGAYQALDPGTMRLNDGSIYFAWISYDGTTQQLTASVDSVNVQPITPLIDVNVDLLAALGSDDAFVGFTAAAGGAYNDHDILSWQFDTMAVPEPAGASLLGIGLAVLACRWGLSTRH